MLADRIDFVLGVDTHKHTHTAAAVTPAGGLVAHLTVAADAAGYRRLLAFADEEAPGRRIWAIEGTGSFGAGLTTHLLEHGEWVVEIDRPKRPARRNGAKTDQLDAVRAAREALAREHLAQPRSRGAREALRVLLTTRENAMRARTKAICQLKDLVVSAPESLRRPLQALPTASLVERCTRLRTNAAHSVEQRYTVLALRTTARRALALQAEAAELEAQLEPLIQQAAPILLDEPGVGPVSAAQLLCSWSHAGRLRSESAFAALACVAPIPASSGQVTRHRLSRSGDRQLNRALHTIIVSRQVHHPETQAYVARRTIEGKSPREIKRCLKRHLARRLFKLLEGPAQRCSPDRRLASYSRPNRP
jgi:transposase